MLKMITNRVTKNKSWIKVSTEFSGSTEYRYRVHLQLAHIIMPIRNIKMPFETVFWVTNLANTNLLKWNIFELCLFISNVEGYTFATNKHVYSYISLLCKNERHCYCLTLAGLAMLIRCSIYALSRS